MQDSHLRQLTATACPFHRIRTMPGQTWLERYRRFERAKSEWWLNDFSNQMDDGMNKHDQLKTILSLAMDRRHVRHIA